MPNFLDSQAAIATQLAATKHPELTLWREQALAQALRVGFPHNKSERWKYAPMRALAAKPYSGTTASPETCDEGLLPPAPRIVFINGRFNAVLTDIHDLPGVRIHSLSDALQSDDTRRLNFLGRQFTDAEAPFASLNTALSEQGILIEVAEDTVIDEALHLVFISQGNSQSSQYLRHIIECRQHSHLRLIEQHFCLGDDSAMSNQMMHIHLMPHALLSHVRIQRQSSQAIQFTRSDAVIAGHASYRRLDIETGGHFSRHELNLDLQGEHAHAHSGGVLWSTGTSTLDTRLSVRHQAPNSQCQLVWRGLADDKARVNFYGGIHIEKGADGSDASLSNKNLLLGRQANINTQPALEIYADEVKAAHGATVGQLDHTALFYLRSRGVPKEQAEMLLSQAFYAEAMDCINDASLIEQLKPFLPKILQPEQDDFV